MVRGVSIEILVRGSCTRASMRRWTARGNGQLPLLRRLHAPTSASDG